MAGTVVLTSTYALGDVRSAVITATGDASDGTFPATTLADLGFGEFSGTLLSIRTNPGATAPDSNYDVTLVDDDGLDRLNGAALNRSSGTSETASLGGFVAQGEAETLTLTISNNATVDAVTVITLTWSVAAVGTGMLNSDGSLPVADADLLTEVQTLTAAVQAEDDAHTSTDSGIVILGVRNDAAAALTDTDGDYSPFSVDSAGRLQLSGVSDVEVVGNVAHDAVDTGNPVKIGGKANSGTPTAVTAGDRVDAWLGLHGQFIVGFSTSAGADGLANASSPIGADGTSNRPLNVGQFNGSTWDRARNNNAASYLASAARTATPSVSDITTYNARGLRVSIDVTAIAATPSVVFTVEVKDSVAGTYTAVLTSAAIVGTGHTELVVMPGITPAANVAAAMALARTMRVLPTHADADSITYSVSVELLV